MAGRAGPPRRPGAGTGSAARCRSTGSRPWAGPGRPATARRRPARGRNGGPLQPLGGVDCEQLDRVRLADPPRLKPELLLLGGGQIGEERAERRLRLVAREHRRHVGERVQVRRAVARSPPGLAATSISRLSARSTSATRSASGLDTCSRRYRGSSASALSRADPISSTPAGSPRSSSASTSEPVSAVRSVRASDSASLIGGPPGSPTAGNCERSGLSGREGPGAGRVSAACSAPPRSEPR